VVCAAVSPAGAQQLLDRVLARVGGVAITLTDARAAIAFGVVTAAPGSAGSIPDAVQPLVDRQLTLVEVARFPPPDPTPAEIDAETARMTARAGDGLQTLLRETGLDEARLRELARDTLRIQAYIDQRFGTAVQVGEDEARRYYDTHPQEFTRNGVTIPFEEAQGDARQRASAERLEATVAAWLTDLRERADVVVNP
jgi:hypothetical protein